MPPGGPDWSEAMRSRFLLVFSALVVGAGLALFAAACGGGGGGDDEQTPTVPGLGDTQQATGDSVLEAFSQSPVPIELTVKSARGGYGDEYLHPAPGNIWLFF